LLATFFHEGAVYSINMNSGKTNRIIDGMKSPHGGRSYLNTYMATSTASGEVVFSDGKVFSFNSLIGKPKELSNMEWLQNSAPMDDSIVTIDANRNSFVIFNPELELLDMVPFNPDWAIQDIAPIRNTISLSLINMIKSKL